MVLMKIGKKNLAQNTMDQSLNYIEKLLKSEEIVKKSIYHGLVNYIIHVLQNKTSYKDQKLSNLKELVDKSINIYKSNHPIWPIILF